MDISEYFNEIQEYIKNNIDDGNLDLAIKSIEDNNIQALVNQDFNNNISIEECGDKILLSLKNPNLQPYTPNTIEGDRGLNKMERKIYNFENFIKNK